MVYNTVNFGHAARLHVCYILVEFLFHW